jgi:large repetitive protein
LTGLACPSSTTCLAVGLSAGSSSPGRVVESGDGGAVWNTITTFGFTSVTAVSCGSTSDCVAIQAGNFLTTDDGGTTWTAAGFPASATFSGLSCPTSTHCVAVGLANSEPVVYFSSDGGNTWTAGSLPSIRYGLAGVACRDALHCYAWDPREAVVTGDGGSTWTQVTQPAGDLPADVSCPTAEECVAAGSGGGMLVTTDAGSDWSPVALPSGVSVVGGVACPTDDVCYAPAVDQQQTMIGAVIESSDGGNSWSVEPMPTSTDRPSQVSCVTATECIAVGDVSDPVVATTDGLTWTAQTLPQLPELSDATGGYLFGGLGVSCVPGTLCVVVGADEAGGVILLQPFSGGPSAPPGAPLDVTAVPYNQEAAVSFAPPASAGGATITSYTVTASDQTDPASGGQTATGSSSPITVTGLTDGDDYAFTITAHNAFGSGPPSDPSTPVVPIPVPSAPLDVSAVADPGTVASATVSFAPPASDGGSPVASYTVTATDQTNPARGGQIANGSSTPIAVSGLTNGDSYNFTVTATNSTGIGPPSAASTPVTMPTVPGEPEITGVIPGNGQVTVSFLAPGNGGAPITLYEVDANDLTNASNGGPTASGTASPITVTGLTNGDSYTFTISACNAVGCSPASYPADDVPTAPTITSAVAGSGQAAVSFSPPASDGGAPVTSYTVTATDHTSPPHGGQTVNDAASPITVTGLTNGDSYTFIVTAANSAGIGPASAASAPVVPVGPANSVTALALSAPQVIYGDEQVERLSVSVAPQSGSSTPTGKVTVKESQTILCSITLASGHGSCTLSSTQLPAAPYHLVATYSGNKKFAKSTSAQEALTVTKATALTALAVSTAKITHGDEQVERLSVTVTPQFASSTPTGTVTVKESTVTLCTITLASAQGSCTLSSAQLPAGTYHLVATYKGNTNFQTATSAKDTLTVIP